ncbi:MAG TPA: imidazolonepropionase [Candidatus Krumholzibacteria bacterium]|nr:imidazolonepropionase [Candidatus Krumholzibacteria bacterium]
MSAVDFVLYNCSEIVSPVGGRSAQRGQRLGDLRRVERAALVARAGAIVDWGPEDQVLRDCVKARDCLEVDARRRSVIPAFVDPHTHAVFGCVRAGEYADRIAGKSYRDIAAAGGGIHASVRDLRARSEDELVALTVERLWKLLAHGTTTVEIKSGYGLRLDDELKQLRAIQRAAAQVPIRVVSTFLGAHEIPLEFRTQRAEYVRLVVHEMLPQAVPLAEFNDVFCEPSVFTLAESEEILRAGMQLGLAPKLHADELETYGGAELACRLGAISADHLMAVSSAGIQALGASDTVAVLLPGTSFGLASRDYAPARMLVQSGAAVALATDFNPGSSHCPSMQAIWSLAGSMLRLTPAEGLVACTLNAAVAIRREAQVGSLEPGKRCDLVVTQGADYREVPYQFGVNNASVVVSEGKVVWSEKPL